MSTSPNERRRRLALAFLVAAAAALAAGCGLPPTRIEFIETLAKDNRKIAKSTADFRTAVQALQKGQPADPAAVHAAYDQMDRTLKQVRSDVSLQLLPANSSSAQGLIDAYKSYLDGEQAMLQNQFKAIVDAVDAGQGQQVVGPQLDSIRAKETELFGPLSTAQMSYANEHHLQIMTVEGYKATVKQGAK